MHPFRSTQWRNTIPYIGAADKVEEVSLPPLQKTTDVRLISVDNKIERVEEELRKLRSEHNSLIPFSRVPTEIMSIIFRDCISDRLTPWHSRMSWLNVTQVCRQWRSIALDSASAWSLIDFSHSSLTHEMILRSKGAPLDIVVMKHILNPAILDGLKEATSHIDRIRTLILHANPSLSDSKTLFTNLNKPAPLLQTLEIYGGSFVSLPDNLLGGEAFRLRELKISGCHFPWSPALLKNLTTLALNEPHNGPLVNGCSRCPSIKQLVEALQNMPGLEVLELLSSLPVHTSDKLLPRHEVELSHLRCLRLSGMLLSCTEILRNITFPPSATVQITCKSVFEPTTEDRDAIPFFDRLCQIYSTSSTSENYFKSLCIDTIFPPFSLRVYTHNDPDDPGCRPARLDDLLSSLFHIHLDLYEIAQSPMNELFRAATRAFPLGQLEELHLVLSLDNTCPENDLVELFGSLDSLKTIALNQHDIRSFLNALRSCDCGSDEKPSSELLSMSDRTSKPCRLVFPALTTMKLTEVYFGGTSNGVEDLLDFLSFRIRHGKPIQKLVIKSCIQLSHSGVDRLSEIVGDVHWDGEVDEEDEDGDDENYWDYDHDDFDDGWGDPIFEYGLPW